MKQKCSIIFEFITTVLGFVFFVAVAVTITLHFRPLYYYDIKALHIAEQTGLSEQLIRANYDVLIDYNSILGSDVLQFPDFFMSKSGKIHFMEVKKIFLMIKWLGIVSFIPFLCFGRYLMSKQSYRFLKWLSILGIGFPVVFGILIGVNWEKMFVQFHQLLFQNDYWLFDPMTDPIITILPDEFFYQCAGLIISIFILQSCIAGILYRNYRIQRKKENYLQY
ncbi:TIGR01906 family membrane protein [Velocimicrobium porci]|uniref:TIGR01906 family membrane protein n=1 Tax=Velocimicrobium porci TaxID=2606634 RepID=A0A6L5Y0U4_9FIRM|nr:TIGR01906 family membrane protein [Velocimicrobium porci]MSS64028.1 TIGR01906 family membrane protein [Velocimicrobium porci]